MIFCPECENKIYPVEENDRLYHQCLKCGFKDEFRETIIHRRTYKGKSTNQNSHVNQFSRFDVSLPRTKKKTCPNVDCISHRETDKQEAVFIMDPISLKLTFVCVCCATDWSYC
jgi:DNA-directed RNA polymerase subunit M/transcription elongation factor TFIIS